MIVPECRFREVFEPANKGAAIRQTDGTFRKTTVLKHFQMTHKVASGID
jgi:hypothetical protein